MIDAIIIILNVVIFLVLVLGLAVTLLIAMMILADLRRYCDLVLEDVAVYRVKRAKIKEAARVREVAKLQEDINNLKKISQARLREEKEAAAAREEYLWGFYDESYARGFDRDGQLLYRGFTVSPEDVFDSYRKLEELDEIADSQIYANTEEL
jgi:hypothetical protein